MSATPTNQIRTFGSPLDGHRLQTLNQVLSGLSTGQLAWVSGYIAGIGGLAASAAVAPLATAPPLAVLYGSQTGNARRVAEALVERAARQGHQVQLVSMGDYRARDLANEHLALIVVSTHGDGEPPESARDLFSFLRGKRAPQLTRLRYAVLGLGDSSYAQFCRAAQDLDARLAELGARRILPRECCDVDFDGAAETWTRRVLRHVEELTPPQTGEVLPLPGVALARFGPASSKDAPFPATLIERRRLTTDDAVGDVRHLALALDPARLRYTPGDSLGVWFHNAPALVEQILDATGLDAAAPIRLGQDDLSLGQGLRERLELTRLHPKVVSGWAQLGAHPGLAELAADPPRLRVYARERQFVDLLSEFSARPSAADLARVLQPLQPRLYSVASSQTEYEDEVHLAVSAVRYRRQGDERLGGASGFLTERLAEDQTLGVYLVENPEFRLPQDGDTPIVMVGAGTGVAPYRAFLQQRAAAGATGRNWLVFGNRHFHRDFLYQLDWQAWRKAGLLHRTSLAFSRDGPAKIYVQHRLREQAADLYRWLAEGAHLYICGGTAMGQAVQDALLEVAVRGGGLNEDAARNFLAELRGSGRHHQDLY